MAKASRSRDLCERPIAGRGEECYESFEDHVRAIVEIERKRLSASSRYASSEYLRYLERVLGSYADRVVAVIHDVNTLVAVFHDVGKCTYGNQRSLRERGTAEDHEFLSVWILGATMDAALAELGENLALKALAPVHLAVLLHHHSMRGGKLGRVRDAVGAYSIGDVDARCAWRCLSSVKDLVPTLLPEDEEAYARRVVGFRERFPRIISEIAYWIPRATDSCRPGAYRVAVLLSSVLLVADVVAARLNRRGPCRSGTLGEVANERVYPVGERDIADEVFVREFLKREELFESFTGAARSKIGGRTAP